MYTPRHFEQADPRAVSALIAANPLGSLVVAGQHGLSANHVPLELIESDGSPEVLVGHIARANPLARALSDEPEVLVMFHGADAYISPSWYRSKAVHGKVVPTWNYVAAHVHGRARLVDDPDWIRTQIRRLTDSQESHLPEPWSLHDAPGDFTAKTLQAVIGIEISISRIEAKWKVSQNRPPADRESVVRALRQQGTGKALEMAAYVAKGGD